MKLPLTIKHGAKITVSIFSALLLLAATNSKADTIAYVENGTETDSGGGYGGGAFDFTLTSSIQVTQLGFYALSIGGGDTPIVDLWDVTTNTLVATTGSLQGLLQNGQWNYFSLTSPVTLTPGDLYQVSAPAYFTPTYPDPTTFTYPSPIVSAGFFNKGSGFGGWTQDSPYTNPVLTAVPTDANFQFNVVPEPSTLALWVMGGVLMSIIGLRRAQANRKDLSGISLR